MRLTKAQIDLLTYLRDEGGGEPTACERVCHPNTASALERRGLLTIEDGDGDFRPWFDCQITPAGLQAIGLAEASPPVNGGRGAEPPCATRRSRGRDDQPPPTKHGAEQ